MENNNTIGTDILEDLRKDYNSLKEQFDRQQIVNEKLLMKTFSSKVSSINAKARVSVFCSVMVIIIAPWAFHYNPVMNLSWEFVAATEIMMFVCLYFTWKYHHSIRISPDDSVVSFAKKISQFRKDIRDWTKIGCSMVAVWVAWMLTELYLKADDHREFIFLTCCLLTGGVIGLIIGLSTNRKIISNCDEILDDIESLD